MTSLLKRWGRSRGSAVSELAGLALVSLVASLCTHMDHRAVTAIIRGGSVSIAGSVCREPRAIVGVKNPVFVDMGWPVAGLVATAGLANQAVLVGGETEADLLSGCVVHLGSSTPRFGPLNGRSTEPQAHTARMYN